MDGDQKGVAGGGEMDAVTANAATATATTTATPIDAAHLPPATMAAAEAVNLPPSQQQQRRQQRQQRQQQHRARSKSSHAHSATLQRSKSYGDRHGFTVHAPDDGGGDDDYDAEKAAATRNGDVGKGVGGIDDEGGGRGGRGGEKPFKEVQWDGEGDAMNPRNFSTAKKWLIVLVVSAGSTCVTCTSSMYTLTYEQITVEFGISRVVATLGLSLFVIGLGLGPMVLGPLSEFYGRRPVYVVSFTFFLIWLVSSLSCILFNETEMLFAFLGTIGPSFRKVQVPQRIVCGKQASERGHQLVCMFDPTPPQPLYLACYLRHPLAYRR